MNNLSNLIHPDAIVVGSGLAGLTACLSMAHNGKIVVLIEKSREFGGSSIFAASGINGVPTKYQPVKGDKVNTLVQDTLKEGKDLCDEQLVQLMVSNSNFALNWLMQLGVDLLEVIQLEGHSMPRTHRGTENVSPGYLIIPTIMEKVKQNPNITVLMESALTKINMENGLVSGIELSNNGSLKTLTTNNLILATGGYSADTESRDSLIKQYRPDLINIPTTNCDGVRGDGHKIALRDCHVKLIDMDQIQINPTGFVSMDPKLANNKRKILCAPLIRHMGGILISPNTGQRFVNENSTRELISNATFNACHLKDSPLTKGQASISVIIVDSKDFVRAQSHINAYVEDGLLRKGTVKDITRDLKVLNPKLSEEILLETFDNYKRGTLEGDQFGRRVFGASFDSGEYCYGLVTPTAHFSMGGIAINNFSQALSQDGTVINNLYSVGEISGGVHGRSRLGGNSLLECVVFGLIAGQNI